MKRRIIPWATALFFITILSCDKNKPDPECKDASCCHPEYNKFVEYIVDVHAHLAGPPQFSTWGFVTWTRYPTGKDDPYVSEVLGVCENSMYMIQNFKPDQVFYDSTGYDTAKMAYNYRVSGKILSDTVNPRLLIRPVLSIYIDKIEKIKL